MDKQYTTKQHPREIEAVEKNTKEDTQQLNRQSREQKA